MVRHNRPYNPWHKRDIMALKILNLYGLKILHKPQYVEYNHTVILRNDYYWSPARLNFKAIVISNTDLHL